MKKLKIFILSGIIICCLSALAALTACSTSVDTPTNLSIDSDTLILTWDGVSGAEGYTVSINGETTFTVEASFDLTYLSAGEYSISVQATDGAYESNWSKEIEFTRESENGLIYSLINNGKEYEVSSIGSAVGEVTVPETFRGKKVTSIGDKAFKNKTKLTSITLTDNITSIGDEAFYGCSYLVSISIPQSVTYIGSSAFYNCIALESDIVIPDGVEEIGEYTFYNCQKISSLTFGSGLTTISAYAFWKCSAITEIIIPDSVTTVGEKAFANCSGATYIEIGDGVTEMDSYVFQYCTSLENVSIGTGIEYLDAGMFMYCSGENFTQVVIPDNVTIIYSYCFYGCTYLSDISVGDNLTAIYSYAFSKTAAYTAAEEAGEMLYVGNSTNDKFWLIDVITPTTNQYLASAFKEGTVGVAAYAFFECETITTVVLPNTVKYICRSAFYKCTSLLSATLGSGALSLGINAFYGCTALSNVYLGAYDGLTRRLGDSSLQSIGRYAFAQCVSLTKIQIPDSVTSIGAFAFYGSGIWPEDSAAGVVYAGTITTGSGNNEQTYGNKWVVGSSYTYGSLFSVYLDDDTVGIADYAFALSTTSSDTMGLNSIIITENVKYIGEAAFYCCYYLQTVIYCNEITEIPNYTFYGCQNLIYLMHVDEASLASLEESDYTFAIPDTVTTIGIGAFAYCFSIGYYNTNCEIVIPSSVQTIGAYAFFNCGYVYTDDDGEPIIDDATGEVTLLGASSIVIEGNAENTVIGEAAFANWHSLKNAVIGDNVTYLGANAFFGCTYLETVSIGTGITAILSRTFYKCESLTSIIIPGNVTSIGEKAFYKNYSLTSVTLGSGVTSIGDYAFYYCTSLETINFPATLTSIGTQAFRSCSSLKAVALSGNLVDIGGHAFFGCNNMTVYMSSDADSSNWSETWNSSYCPVVYNCTISSNGYVSYIILTEEQYSNVYSGSQLSSPTRSGYTFVGWATNVGSSTAEYSWDDLADLEEGTKLYAVWKAE